MFVSMHRERYDSRMTWAEWWSENARRVRRTLGIASAALGAIVLVHFVWTVFDVGSLLSSRTQLEREHNVVFVQPERVRLWRHASLDALDARTRAPCTLVRRVSSGRTSPRTDAQPHYKLSNLFNANHQLIKDNGVAFAMPKMYGTPDVDVDRSPDACVLSIIVQGEIYSDHDSNATHAHIVDMVNPTELELRPGERSLAPDTLVLRDLLVGDRPLVEIESRPLMRVNYRTEENESRNMLLRGDNAHMMRVALHLLNRGEPLSSWGTRVRTHDADIDDSPDSAPPPPPPSPPNSLLRAEL